LVCEAELNAEEDREMREEIGERDPAVSRAYQRPRRSSERS
jgi:hypothetical protein